MSKRSMAGPGKSLVAIVGLVAVTLLVTACVAPRAADAPANRTATTAAAAPPPDRPAPAVLAFAVNPTATLQVGDVIDVRWSAVGATADLCMISGPGPVDCQAVSLTGQQPVTVTAQMLGYRGIGLRANAGDTFAWGLADLRFACQAGAWYFANPPDRCPETAPVVAAAAYQPFEHGFMIWTQTPDRFYVFFDDAQQFLFADAPYNFAPEQPAPAPPDGLYAPVSGFGKLWRNELAIWQATDIRSRLSWATAPETAYTATRQCELPSYPGMWSCYLQAPDGRVLATRPDSTAQVHFVWAWQ